MKIKILVIAIAISATIVNAQNEIDALRYSTHELSGTARYSAMGGAFGSLGGEFSSLSSNIVFLFFKLSGWILLWSWEKNSIE